MSQMNIHTFIHSLITTCRAHCVDNVELESLEASWQVVSHLRQRRMYMFLPVFVCLSVSKITQKRVHGFG